MKSVFMLQGKPWNDKIEQDVKRAVSEYVAEKLEASLNVHKRNSKDNS
jgi:hypothetical protein